jgi:hypothetical protein
VPGGAKQCDCCFGDSVAGRFVSGLFECICCPDPCYDPPKWLAVADSAFFVDAARPITQARLRWDSAFDFRNPDRAEYFWAKMNAGSPPQQIASCRGPGNQGNGPNCLAKKVDYEDLAYYNEAATGRLGAFIEVPYREVDPTAGIASDPANPCCSKSGFADLIVGTKTLIWDCELMQFSFQFKTFIPTASPANGFGTGHVSLEPAFLLNLKISETTYLQAMSAYWIPIGGDPVFQANIWHNHFSLNHILWNPCHDLALIGTAELNEWTVYGGAYTVTDYGSAVPAPNTKTSNVFANSASTSGMCSAGPGLRLIICEKYDLGVGSAFAFTGSRFASEMVRAEFRMRF